MRRFRDPKYRLVRDPIVRYEGDGAVAHIMVRVNRRLPIRSGRIDANVNVGRSIGAEGIGRAGAPHCYEEAVDDTGLDEPPPEAGQAVVVELRVGRRPVFQRRARLRGEFALEDAAAAIAELGCRPLP